MEVPYIAKWLDCSGEEDGDCHSDAEECPGPVQDPHLFLLRQILPAEERRAHRVAEHMLRGAVDNALVGQEVSGGGGESKHEGGELCEVHGRCQDIPESCETGMEMGGWPAQVQRSLEV